MTPPDQIPRENPQPEPHTPPQQEAREASSWLNETTETPPILYTENSQILLKNVELLKDYKSGGEDVQKLFESLKTLLAGWSFKQACNQFFSYLGSLWGKSQNQEEKQNPRADGYNMFEADIPIEQIQHDIAFRQQEILKPGLTMTQRKEILRQISSFKQQIYAKKHNITGKEYRKVETTKEFQDWVLFDEIKAQWVWTVLNFSDHVTGNNWLSKGVHQIMWLYKSNNNFIHANHTAIVSKIEWNDIYIIEADKKWVHETKLTDYLAVGGFRNSWVVTMNLNITPQQRLQVVQEVASSIGQSYDRSGLQSDILHPTDTQKPENNQKYCSELILDAVRQVTWQGLENIHTPNELGGLIEMFQPTYSGLLWGRNVITPTAEELMPVTS